MLQSDYHHSTAIIAYSKDTKLMKRAIRLSNPEKLIESAQGKPIDGQMTGADQALEYERLYIDRSSEHVRLGIWRSDPYEARYEDYGCDEFMILLTGQVSLLYDDGSEDHFQAGDAFILPKGFTGVWRQPAVTLKYFAMV